MTSKCSFCYQNEIFWIEPGVWYYGKPLVMCKDCYGFFFAEIAKYFCINCKKPYIKGFSFSTKCRSCYKKSKIDPAEKQFLQEVFAPLRKKAISQDTQEIQEKREKFILKLSLETSELLQLWEMYPAENKEGSYSKQKQSSQYFSEWKFCNTRKKLKNETLAEIDCLPFEEALKVICQIALILLNSNQSFKIFYAEGQRSPHLRVYNLNFLEPLSEYERYQAQVFFWKKVSGELFKFLDKKVWEDEQPLPLEYSIHWKYQTHYVEYEGLE